MSINKQYVNRWKGKIPWKMQTNKDYLKKHRSFYVFKDIDFLIINLPIMKILGTKIPCAF